MADSNHEQLKLALIAERRVRALAETSTPDWTGAPRTLLSFERGLSEVKRERHGQTPLERWPFEWLERWSHWEALLASVETRQLSAAALGQLAQSRALYDPASAHRRLSTLLSTWTPQQQQEYRAALMTVGRAQLQGARRSLQAGSGVAAQLLSLVQARRVALEYAYPALLSRAQRWPHDEARLPHVWRAELGLSAPKAVDALDTLYAFGSQAEARRVLLATRGLNLVAAEKRAQRAFQAGYYDGAVRLLRDESALVWRDDLEQWPYLSSARREKLSVLLGAERSPLGPVALDVAEQLLAQAG